MNTTNLDNIDLDTDIISKQIEEANKPMSIIDIQKKFNLSFPFKVKRVRGDVFNGVTIITEIRNTVITKGSDFGKEQAVTNNSIINRINGEEWRTSQSATTPDYIPFFDRE